MRVVRSIVTLLLFSIFFHQEISCFSINQEPLYEIFTPAEFYTDTNFQTCYVGERPRYSTCSSINWFHNDQYLATVNFEGGFICTYDFTQINDDPTPMQVIYGTNSAPLKGADHLSFSPDGTLLAVSINHARHINIYRVNTQNHLIDPEAIAVIKHSNPAVHGIRFTNKSNYLVCTTIRGTSVITTYNIGKKNRKISFDAISNLKNDFLPLKPKSLDFTKDDQYVVVVYAANVTVQKNETGGLIATYKFDKSTGIIDQNPVSVYRNEEFKGGEDIRLNKNDSAIFVSEHASDIIKIYSFNKNTGAIGKKITQLENPMSRLSFPHGLALSSNGKYLGVTNYGDDKFAIYSIL
ncbi:MAG TPA: beta-propeller fold lactonase family protein [Candidatus Babeliales bacterium]|nr:beta-propeller fold lactonase family protein [Candidatus Babeliales bacterium]